MAVRRAIVLDSNGIFVETPTGDTIYGSGVDINPNVITVRTSGGDFTSIAVALASITGNTSTNPFDIHVGVGVFIEPLIDMSLYPYVSIQGDGINSTIIEPDANNHHVFKMGVYNEISFLTIQGAGTGYAGIWTSNGGEFSQVHKVSLYDCDINVLAENTNTDSTLYLEYVDFGGAFSYGIKQINTGTGSNFVNVENMYSFPTSGLVTCYHIEGANSLFEMLASGNENLGGVGGNGLVLHTGAIVNIMAAYFTSFTNAFSMPNTGAAPILTINGTKLDNNTVACNIAHTSGTGCFQGTTKVDPTFTIATGAVFGIQYLERTLGNKKQIIFDSASFNLVAGITPTTSAATRATLTATGFSLITLPGTGGTVYGASVNFRIPSDYQSRGRFKIVYTSVTNANNIKLSFVLTASSIGEDMGTQTETGLSVISAATTQYQMRETNWVTPTTTFVIGDEISIRMYRDPGDVSDTANVDCYVKTLFFEYESNK